jgi:hypothetical protein
MGNQAPPIKIGAATVALDERLFQTSTVAASPAAGTITVVATLTLNGDLVITEGVLLVAYAAYTVGTNGVTALWQIRRTDATGTIIKASGAKTVVAATLVDEAIVGFDTGAVLPNQVYALCATIGSGSAESLVSAVTLAALVI